MDTALRRYDRV